MILAILLTMVFGFGVITLATIALLNVAGMRVHDLREVRRERSPSVFRYAYTSPSAYALRSSVGKLPRRLMWGAIIAVSFVTASYAIVDSGTSVDAQECECVDGQRTVDMRHLDPIGVITWVPITGYVVVLLWVAGSISRRCYVVMKEIDHRRP